MYVIFMFLTSSNSCWSCRLLFIPRIQRHNNVHKMCNMITPPQGAAHSEMSLVKELLGKWSEEHAKKILRSIDVLSQILDF